MTYLVGIIERVGGQSGKRIYFKEFRAVSNHYSHLEIRSSFYNTNRFNFLIGSLHCFSCPMNFIDRALSFHNDDVILIIKIENDTIIEMTKIHNDIFQKIIEEIPIENNGWLLRFTNSVIDIIKIHNDNLSFKHQNGVDDGE